MTSATIHQQGQGQGEGEDEDAAYEARHVHAVYQEIADHFSRTRHKPWPIVERFLTDLAAGSVGLDVGCGNGKYLGVNRHVFILASDRSSNLARIASSSRPPLAALLTADVLDPPHRPRRFDFAICVAVVHHLRTAARRVAAVAAILDALKTGGRALIYVWALEQKHSRRGWDAGDAQDVLVPWVSAGGSESAGAGRGADQRVYQRYYHLYRQGELEADVVSAGGEVVESGYEKDNWWAITTPRASDQGVK